MYANSTYIHFVKIFSTSTNFLRIQNFFNLCAVIFLIHKKSVEWKRFCAHVLSPRA